MGSFLRLLGMKNNEHENPISKLSILECFLSVFVIDFCIFTVFYNDFGCVFASGAPSVLFLFV